MHKQSTAVLQATHAFWTRLRGAQPERPGISLALGGGFVRGMAHIGVFRVLEREGIPIARIAGVSAGAIVAALYASGVDPASLAAIAKSMRFRDVASWRPGRLGLAVTERMEGFLRHFLKAHRFEDFRIPLTVVATDLRSGDPVLFQGTGDVFTAIRASCAYPGMFQPVRHNGRYLVDGAMSMEIPARALKDLGAGRVVSVVLEAPNESPDPTSMFSVVNRCFQIVQRRTRDHWLRYSDLVIAPQVGLVCWDDFSCVDPLIAAGERAAEEALPVIRKWTQARSIFPSLAAAGPVPVKST